MQDMVVHKAGEPEKRDGHDDIEASKAPLMEHLIELRTRLIYSLLAFFAMFVVCFAVARPIFNVLLGPYVRVVGADKANLIATHFLEQLYTNIKLAMFGAAFLSFPLMAYQIYKFVAPGLYKNERDAFRPYLLWAWLLFVLGALVVYFVVMPLLIKFSVDLTPQAHAEGQAGIQLLPKVSEYLSLIMQLILGFGVIFQLPVVLSLIARAGVIDGDALRNFRRYAIIAITAVSAVLSPPDPMSMIAMMLPTILLYEASILIVDRIAAGKNAAVAKKAEEPPAA
jgi:sec-independent protein translocase protein TatC